MMYKKKIQMIFTAFLAAVFLMTGCAGGIKEAPPVAAEITESLIQETESTQINVPETASVEDREIDLVKTGTETAFSLSDIPEFSGMAYVAVNGNVPYFTEDEITTVSFETYSDLDSLGRCGAAFASVGQDLMPTEERGAIGSVKPTGWHTVKYDIVDGKYLYNRCHLIGYQLTAENANEKNLITGTRYLNIDGMLSFENLVADYVKETDNHVLYRVTPIFEGDNLLAAGVLMEGMSVEDDGDGVLFCVFAYNAQPGVSIDYATGESWLNGEPGTASVQETASTQTATETTAAATEATSTTTSDCAYVLNTNTMKFHKPSCSSVAKIADKNKKESNESREDLVAQGYSPCGICKP